MAVCEAAESNGKIGDEQMETQNYTKKDELNVSAQVSKRPRWLTLCMMATAASVIVLAGCGDNEEVAPPAEDPATLEQNSAADPAPGMNGDTSMEQDPGLGGESSSQGTMTQPEGSGAENNMTDPAGSTSEETMPEDTMDEPMDNSMDDDAGFGEGTDPMPGADEDSEETTVN